MKPKVFVLVFDGLADWEPALALCEINKTGKFEVVSVGFSDSPVTTMGGIKLIPDITLEQLTPAEAAVFMLPGGDRWEQQSHENLQRLLGQLHAAGVLIVAICGATLEIARAGLTSNIRHTSNSKSYLKENVPGYTDEDFYIEELAVTDRHIITASGLGSVEMAREVMMELQLYDEMYAQVWFEMFKHAVLPPHLTSGRR